MGLHDVVKTHYTGPTRDVNLCNYRRLFFVFNLLSSAPGPRGLVFFFFCSLHTDTGRTTSGQRYTTRTTAIPKSGAFLFTKENAEKQSKKL